MTDAGLTHDVIALRLLLSAVLGGIIGYERRMHHKAVGISGMMLVAIGSATYMLLALHATETDAGAVGRAIQGLMQGIGFLGGAVIFKGGTDVRGIKTAAAIWITGAIGMATGTGFWLLGLVVGVVTAAVLFLADLSSPQAREVDDGDPSTPPREERPEKAQSQA